MDISGMTKKEAVRVFREKLGTDDKWAVRGLVAVYNRQTSYEQRAGTVQEDNGVGFTGADAEFLTSLARQTCDRGLSEKQMACLKRRMPKYAGQLLKIAKKEV